MTNLDISPRLLAYLASWHATSTKRKAAQGIQVDLSFDEFLVLIDKRQMKSLQRAIDSNRIRDQQNEKNPFAYVLTWKSYAACSSRVFNRDTACVCSRMKSARINLPQAGDKLRPEHAAAIGAKLRGKAKTPEHRKAISQGSRGTSKTPWTEERKAARRAQIVARKAGVCDAHPA